MFNEKYAVGKHPKKGKCSKSPFANGNHRVGWFPISSALDGGAPGCSMRLYCLECGKKFSQTAFEIRNQPSTIVQQRLSNDTQADKENSQ